MSSQVLAGILLTVYGHLPGQDKATLIRTCAQVCKTLSPQISHALIRSCACRLHHGWRQRRRQGKTRRHREKRSHQRHRQGSKLWRGSLQGKLTRPVSTKDWPITPALSCEAVTSAEPIQTSSWIICTDTILILAA